MVSSKSKRSGKPSDMIRQAEIEEQALERERKAQDDAQESLPSPSQWARMVGQVQKLGADQLSQADADLIQQLGKEVYRRLQSPEAQPYITGGDFAADKYKTPERKQAEPVELNSLAGLADIGVEAAKQAGQSLLKLPSQALRAGATIRQVGGDILEWAGVDEYQPGRIADRKARRKSLQEQDYMAAGIDQLAEELIPVDRKSLAEASISTWGDTLKSVLTGAADTAVTMLPMMAGSGVLQARGYTNAAYNLLTAAPMSAAEVRKELVTLPDGSVGEADTRILAATTAVHALIESWVNPWQGGKSGISGAINKVGGFLAKPLFEISKREGIKGVIGRASRFVLDALLLGEGAEEVGQGILTMAAKHYNKPGATIESATRGFLQELTSVEGGSGLFEGYVMGIVAGEGIKLIKAGPKGVMRGMAAIIRKPDVVSSSPEFAELKQKMDSVLQNAKREGRTLNDAVAGLPALINGYDDVEVKRAGIEYATSLKLQLDSLIAAEREAEIEQDNSGLDEETQAQQESDQQAQQPAPVEWKSSLEQEQVAQDLKDAMVDIPEAKSTQVLQRFAERVQSSGDPVEVARRFAGLTSGKLSETFTRLADRWSSGQQTVPITPDAEPIASTPSDQVVDNSDLPPFVPSNVSNNVRMMQDRERQADTARLSGLGVSAPVSRSTEAFEPSSTPPAIAPTEAKEPESNRKPMTLPREQLRSKDTAPNIPKPYAAPESIDEVAQDLIESPDKVPAAIQGMLKPRKGNKAETPAEKSARMKENKKRESFMKKFSPIIQKAVAEGDKAALTKALETISRYNPEAVKDYYDKVGLSARKLKPKAAVTETPSEPPAPAAEVKPEPDVKEPAPAPAPSAPVPSSSKKIKPNFPNDVAVGPKGTKVDIEYMAVEADDIKVTLKMGENQNRDRESPASKQQIEKMAARLIPDKLITWYPNAETAAPIIAETGDGKYDVDGGNGRTAAIQLAYKNGTAEEYRNTLIALSSLFGLDPEAISKMKNPIFVRVRRTPMNQTKRTSWVVEINEDDKKGLDAVEKSSSDTAAVMANIEKFSPSESGDLEAESNRPFFLAFFRQVAPGDQLATYIDDKTGALTQDGVTRMKNAVFMSAFKNKELAALYSKATDDNIKGILKGLVLGMASTVRLNDGIETGRLHSRTISRDIAEAALWLEKIRETGKTADKYFADIEEERRMSPNLPGMETEVVEMPESIYDLVRWMSRFGGNKFRDIGNLLNDFYGVVESFGDARQPGLFGQEAPPTTKEILEELLKTYGYVKGGVKDAGKNKPLLKDKPAGSEVGTAGNRSSSAEAQGTGETGSPAAEQGGGETRTVTDTESGGNAVKPDAESGEGGQVEQGRDAGVDEVGRIVSSATKENLFDTLNSNPANRDEIVKAMRAKFSPEMLRELDAVLEDIVAADATGGMSLDALAEAEMQGMDAGQVGSIAEGITKNWKGKPNIVVLQSTKEYGKKIPALARGKYDPDTNTAYLFADNLDTTDDIKTVLFHEVIGHHGVMKVLGKNADFVIKGVLAMAKTDTEVKAIMDSLGRYKADAKAYEVFAVLAERLATDPMSFTDRVKSFVRSVFGRIQNALRSLGIDIDFNNNDLAWIMRAAAREVESGSGVGQKAGAGNMFSLKPAFKSKMIEFLKRAGLPNKAKVGEYSSKIKAFLAAGKFKQEEYKELWNDGGDFLKDSEMTRDELFKFLNKNFKRIIPEEKYVKPIRYRLYDIHGKSEIFNKIEEAEERKEEWVEAILVNDPSYSEFSVEENSDGYFYLLDEDGEVVNSFKTRAAADKAAESHESALRNEIANKIDIEEIGHRDYIEYSSFPESQDTYKAKLLINDLIYGGGRHFRDDTLLHFRYHIKRGKMIVDEIQSDINQNNSTLNKKRRDYPEYADKLPENLVTFFENSWEELAIKNILQEAVAKGTTEVIWPEGSVHVDRYSLKRIITGPVSYMDGRLYVNVLGKNGKLFKKEFRAQPWQIEDYVGRTIAKKLLSSPKDSRGYNNIVLDENVDFENTGLKKFYDETIVSKFNKILKPSGVQVEKKSFEVDQGRIKVWSFEVTPAVESIVKEGFDLYSISPLHRNTRKIIETAQTWKDGVGDFESFARRIMRVYKDASKPFLKAAYNHMRDALNIGGLSATETVDEQYEKIVKETGITISMRTARQESTKTIDTKPLLDAIGEAGAYLRPHQAQGAAQAVATMEAGKGFLNSDGTGAGKTAQMLAVGEYFRRKGKAVIIITQNRQIINGSFKSDAAGMKMSQHVTGPFKVGQKMIQPGKIVMSTYHYLEGIRDEIAENPMDYVVMFDESQALMNVESGASSSSRGALGMELADAADAVMFSSATPEDKPQHMAYLRRVHNYDGGKIEDFYRGLGLIPRHETFKGKAKVVWQKDPRLSDKQMLDKVEALFDKITAEGRMIKREIDMSPLTIKIKGIELSQSDRDKLNEIMAFIMGGENSIPKPMKEVIALMHQRRYQEPLKIAPTVDIVKDALARGRQAIIFLTRLNESVVKRTDWVTIGGEKYATVRELTSSEGTVDTLRAALKAEGITDIVELHSKAGTSKQTAVDNFQTGKAKVIITTVDSGGAGINLDDVRGDVPRTVIMMTAPFSGIANMQAIGRPWRLNTKSVPEYYYLFSDHPVDDWNAGIILEKMMMLGATVSGQVKSLNFDKSNADFSGVVDDDGYFSLKPVKQPALVKLPFEMPELLDLVRGLNEGKNPIIKEKLRNRRALGVFYPNPDNARIEIRADIFVNRAEGLYVVAHELGHMIDFLPDKLLSRGNILGRLATLKNYTGRALTEIIGSNKKIRDELKDYSNKIRSDEKRSQSVELYADAFALIATNPARAAKDIPLFHRAFFDNLYKKPEVLKLYDKIQEEIDQGDPALAVKREVALKDAIERAEQAYAKRRSIKHRKPFLDWFKFHVIDKNSLINDMVDKVKNDGIAISPETNPAYALEEYAFTTGEISGWVDDMAWIKRSLDQAGIDWSDLDLMLFYERVAYEKIVDEENVKRGRAFLANPRGHDTKTAELGIKQMEARLGPKKFEILKEEIKNFRKSYKYVWNKVKAAELLPDDVWEMLDNNPYYATFQVVHYLEQENGVNMEAQGKSSGIKRQIGTFSDVAGAGTATIEHGIFLLKNAARAIAIKKTFDFLQKHNDVFEEEAISEAKYVSVKRGSGNPRMEPTTTAPMGKKVVQYVHKGKLLGKIVDEYIAESFDRSPVQNQFVAGLLAPINSIVRKLFTTLNIGFMPFNLIRDFQRFSTNAPGYSNLWETFEAYASTWEHAKEFGFGNGTDLVNFMKKNHMLIVTEDRSHFSEDDLEIEHIINKFGIGNKGTLHKALYEQPLDWLKGLGATLESWSKLAAYQFLKKKFPQMSTQEIGYKVRNHLGSPNFMRQGQSYHLLNNLFLFFNAFKEGARADIEVAKQSPWEVLFKTVMFNIMPRVALVGLAYFLAGMGDDRLKKALERISWYDFSQFNVMPIMMEGNKLVYLRLPQNESGRLISGVLFGLMKVRSIGDLAKVFEFGAGQFPGFSPVGALTLDWLDYAGGNNPYSRFRQKNVIDQTVFAAGGTPALIEMFKHTANSLGINAILKFEQYEDMGDRGSIEKAVEFPLLVNNLIGRFIKVSDTGVSDKIRSMAEDETQGEARKTLSENKAIIESIKSIGADKAFRMNDAMKRNAAMRTYRRYIKENEVKFKGPKAFREEFNGFYTRWKNSAERGINNPEEKALMRLPKDIRAKVKNRLSEE